MHALTPGEMQTIEHLYNLTSEIQMAKFEQYKTLFKNIKQLKYCN